MSDITVGKIEQLTGLAGKRIQIPSGMARMMADDAASLKMRIDELEVYLCNLLADIDHAWETRAIPGLRYIEYQFSRNETEELRKLIGGKG